MFCLWGDIARIYGSTIPRVVMTLSRVEMVAVAVSAIMWTCGGIKLRTSPNLENSFLKNATLVKKNTKTSVYTLMCTEDDYSTVVATLAFDYN